MHRARAFFYACAGRLLMLALFLGACAGACGGHDVLGHRRPVIASLTVFPGVITRADSWRPGPPAYHTVAILERPDCR
jgi:hypothetical protein